MMSAEPVAPAVSVGDDEMGGCSTPRATKKQAALLVESILRAFEDILATAGEPSGCYPPRAVVRDVAGVCGRRAEGLLE